MILGVLYRLCGVYFVSRYFLLISKLGDPELLIIRPTEQDEKGSLKQFPAIGGALLACCQLRSFQGKFECDEFVIMLFLFCLVVRISWSK